MAPAEAPRIRVRVLVTASGTAPFDEWLSSVRDAAAKARLLQRLLRIERDGNFGDHRERIRGAVSELRLDAGPGYRVYYVLHGTTLVILLCGGTKASQEDDIERAAELWEGSKEDVEGLSREFRP